jgi:hypothetical protein
MSWWGDIQTDFVELMGVDLANSLHNSFFHTYSGADVTLLQDTSINGAFALEFSGFSQAERDINGWLTLVGDVTLRLSFKINSEAVADPNAATDDPVNDKADYSNAVEDITAIIAKRLDPTTYTGVLDSVELLNAGGLVFTNETENYAYCNITFRVGKIQTL